MKRCRGWLLVTLIVSLVGGAWTTAPARAWGLTEPCSAGPTFEQKLSGEFREWDAATSTSLGLFFTNLMPPGIPIYQKIIDVGAGCDTLEVTLGAGAWVSDITTGTTQLFTCKVDFAPCNPGTTFTALVYSGGGTLFDPTGWISLNHSGFPAQGIYYTWCTPITPGPGTHAVELRMASGINNTFVLIEGEHFFIHTSQGSGCSKAATPIDPNILPGPPPFPLPQRPPTSTPNVPSVSAPPTPTAPPLPGLP